MKILCEYSGVDFYTRDFLNMRVSGIHPLFSLPSSSLLSRAGDWGQGKLSPEECRILFIALLHSTDHLDFHTAALPTNQTIQYHMQKVFHTVGWYHTLDMKNMILPKYAVNHATRDLKNIGLWLDSWNEIKDDWINGQTKSAQSRRKLERLAIREESLSRLIKSYSKKSEDYAWRLAAWALDASDDPEEHPISKDLKEYWTTLFKLRGNSIYLASTNDLDEMVEHMEKYLPHGDIFSHAVLKHVRALLFKNKSGDFGLGIPTGTDLTEMHNNPYKIVEDDIEIHNVDVVIASAPEEEPRKSDYPDLVSFIRAKAAFYLKNKKNELQKRLEEEQMAASKLDAFIASEGSKDAEDAMFDKTDEMNAMLQNFAGQEGEEL